MIIIADAHVSHERGNVDGFFHMLAAFSRLDRDLIFLGDIFDLWIGIPRYEQDIHRRFRRWCETNARKRRIWFLEGNHEFFLSNPPGPTPREAAPDNGKPRYMDTTCMIDETGCGFSHGDQINRSDRRYLLFRRFTRSWFGRFLLQAAPSGPLLTDCLRRAMKNGNKAVKRWFPETDVRRFAAERFEDGAHTLFLGHFHREMIETAGAPRLCLAPAWFTDGRVVVVNRSPEPSRMNVRACPWWEAGDRP